jgi:hypothetical protein
MAERGFGFERAFAEINLDRHNIEALIFRGGPLPSALSENVSLAEILATLPVTALVRTH